MNSDTIKKILAGLVAGTALGGTVVSLMPEDLQIAIAEARTIKVEKTEENSTLWNVIVLEPQSVPIFSGTQADLENEIISIDMQIGMLQDERSSKSKLLSEIKSAINKER